MGKGSELALHGGVPVRIEPFPVWPIFDQDERLAVQEVLEGSKVNYWTGEQGMLFEEEFADYLGVRYAVALANGSLALDTAMHILDIGPGDEVIVPCRTFIATAGCVVLAGAKPVFADVDLSSQNIGIETIKDLVTDKTKAIIVVHLAGMPVDLTPIMDLAEKKGIWVVEDCAQAHGGAYMPNNWSEAAWSKLGTIGDLGCYSFCQDKIMTTGGEGGILVTNNEELWHKAWTYKDHGKDYGAVFHDQHPPGFCWLHYGLGTNIRLTEMQAAIGRKQLDKLDKWVQRRRSNAELLNRKIGQIDLFRICTFEDRFYHSYYKYYFFVHRNRLRPDWDRDKIMWALSAEGIPCFTGICPEVYLEKVFQDLNYFPEKRLSNGQELGETSLMLLVHPTLTERDLLDMCQAVEKVAQQAVN